MSESEFCVKYFDEVVIMNDTSSQAEYSYVSLYSGCIYSDVSKQIFEKRRKQLAHIYKFMYPIFAETFDDLKDDGHVLHLSDRNGVVAFCSNGKFIGKMVRSLKYSGPEMLDILHKSYYLCVTAYEILDGQRSGDFAGMWYVLRDLNGEPFAIIMNRKNGTCSKDFIDKCYTCCQMVQSYVDNYFTQQALIDTMPNAVMIASFKGKVKMINKVLKKHAGEDIIGTGVCSLENTVWENGDDPKDMKLIKVLGHEVITDTKLDHFGYNGREAAHIIVLDASVKDDSAPKEERATDHPALRPIVGESPEMRAVKDTILRIAKKPVSVLIQGESGTGKELIAKSIHDASGRTGRFVPINCGAIDRNLLQSELFGYEEGSFTGALRGGKKGKIELANGGTLFLDEIGEMPFDMQVSLLRVLEERRVMPLGAKAERKVDIRVIAATNRDLKEEIQNGSFRSDLYFRLAVIPIYLPPLRERREDVASLVRVFIKRICNEYGLDSVHITDDFYDALDTYPWHGNVRELRNTLEYILLMSNGETIDARFLEHTMSKVTLNPEGGKSSSEKARDREKSELIATLESCGYNKSKAAQLLGISRKTLYVRMAKYGLEL